MKNVLKSLCVAGSLLFATIASADVAPAGSTLVKQAENYKNADGTVVVQQFLWNKCIHCYNLDPLVDKWEKEKANYVTFERIPVGWSEANLKDGSFYNYAKVLKKTGKVTDDELAKINADLFKIVFVDGKELNAANALPVFTPYGVKTAEDLEKLTTSFVTSSEKNRSKTLTDKYGINGVPVFVVAGKYLVSFQSIGENPTPAKLFETLDRLAKAEHEATKTEEVKVDKEVPAVEAVTK